MYQRKPRRFRRRSNGRGRPIRSNGDIHRLRTDSYSNEHNRNRFRPTQSAEKLFEKYNTLAKEALSSGDKTLSENYLQHADHFMRIIEYRNKIQNQNRVQVIDKNTQSNKEVSDNKEGNKDNPVEEKKE